MLYVLGELTAYQPRKPIYTHTPKAPGHDALMDDILRAAGFDPGGDARMLPASTWDNFESLPLPRTLYGSSHPIGMYRRVYLTVHERSLEYTKPRPHGFRLFRKMKGGWALSEQGVAAAVSIRDHFKNDSRNITAVWLDTQMNEGLYDTMLSNLTMSPHMAKDRSSGEIKDHLHQYFSDCIRRDSLRTWLLRGDAPSANQLSSWAIRKGISTFRRRAQDALHRSMRGALTARERIEGVPGTQAMSANPYKEIMQDSSEDEDATQGQMVLVDDSAQDAYHQVAWEEGMVRIREAIRRHKAGNPERYVGIFDLMCEDMTVMDIGEMEGVSRNRAAGIMAGTRTAIRSAAQAAKDARCLLTYIWQEPFATIEDIEEQQENPDPRSPAVKISTRLPWLLAELVEHGRLKNKDGCYLITERGEAFLREWNLQSENTGDFALRVSL